MNGNKIKFAIIKVKDSFGFCWDLEAETSDDETAERLGCPDCPAYHGQKPANKTNIMKREASCVASLMCN